jgi:hypothetical protein
MYVLWFDEEAVDSAFGILVIEQVINEQIIALQ